MDEAPVVRVGVRDFRLSDHAVERYRDRVRPLFSLEEACGELVSRLRRAEVHLTRPGWARSFSVVGEGRYPDEFVAVEADELLFPVRSGCILTTLTPEHVGATVRWVT